MAVCENCNGEGELFADRFDPHRGHYTVQLPCPDCEDGLVDDAALDTVEEIRRELTGPIRRPGPVLELGACELPGSPSPYPEL